MDFSVVFLPFVQSPFPPVSPPTRTSVSSWKYKLKTELSDCAPCLVLMQSVMHALFFRKSRHAEGKTRVRLRPSVCVRRPCCPPDSAKCHLRRRCKKIVMSSNLFLSAFLLLSPFRYKVFPSPSRKLCTESGGIIALAALSFKLCQNGFKDQT